MCDTTLTPKQGLEMAIAAVSKPGRPCTSTLARLIRVRPQAISKWKRAGRVPVERVRTVSSVSGVPDYVLRPDHYLKPDEGTSR